MNTNYNTGETKIEGIFKGKNVLFLTTKELSYIRNVQWERLLCQNSQSVEIAGNENKKYFFRIASVYKKGIKCFFSRKEQMIFAGFAPQLMLPLLSLFQLRGKTIVIDFFISMYDTFVWDRKKFAPESLIAKMLHWLDKATISKADYIIGDTNAHINYFVEEYGANINKCYTVYLKADSNIYSKREQVKSPELKDKFVVLYFGSVLPLQGVNIVLDAMEILKDREDIRFILIGDVSKIKDINQKKYKNIIFYKWLPQEQLAKQIAMADLCLAGHFNQNIEKAKRTIAGKTYIYKAMGKPVVLGDNRANKELFDERVLENYYVPMGNAEELAKTIIKAERDWSVRKSAE